MGKKRIIIGEISRENPTLRVRGTHHKDGRITVEPVAEMNRGCMGQTLNNEPCPECGGPLRVMGRGWDQRTNTLRITIRCVNDCPAGVQGTAMVFGA